MKAVSKALQNRFIQGGVILTISNFIVSILNYFSNSLTAKALGPEGVGELFALFAYLTIGSTPFLIMTTVILKKLGVDKNQRLLLAKKIEAWFMLHVVKNPLYYACLIALGFVLPYISGLSVASSITLILLIAIGFPGTLYLALLQGMHFFILYSLGLITISLFRFSSAIAVYYGLGSLNLVYILLICGAATPIVLGVYSLKKNGGIDVQKSGLDMGIGVRNAFFRPAIMMTTFSMMNLILFNNIDVAYVRRFFSDEILGLYGSWSILAKILGYVIAPINTIALIFFTAHETKNDQKRVLYIMTTILALGGVIMLTIYERFSYLIIDTFFSSQFYEIQPYMTHAVFFGMSFAIATLVNNYLISKNDRKSFAIAFFTIVYLCLLLAFGKTFDDVMNINVIISFVMTCFYIILLLHTK